MKYKAYTEAQKPTDFVAEFEGAGCAIMVDGRILFLQRHPDKKYQGGTWGIPAGKLEIYETPEQGAQRETLEEAGIDIPAGSMQLVGSLYFSQQQQIPHLNYRFYVYRIFMQDYPRVKLEPDQVAFCWMTPEEVLQLKVFDGTHEVLELLNRPHL